MFCLKRMPGLNAQGSDFNTYGIYFCGEDILQFTCVRVCVKVTLSKVSFWMYSFMNFNTCRKVGGNVTIKS